MLKKLRIYILIIILILITFSSVNSKSLLNNNTNLREKTILITGFESWQIYTPNPSQLIVENLTNFNIRGAEINTIILPVLWDKSVDYIINAIHEYDPDIVISLGTGVIDSIHVERIGKNIKSCREPDNNGKIYLLRKIDPNGPFFRFSTLPVNKIVRKINNEKIPAERTFNAGSFICNEVMYGILNYIDDNDLNIKAGFIHVPMLLSQNPENGMKIDYMIDGIKIAVSACL